MGKEAMVEEEVERARKGKMKRRIGGGGDGGRGGR
jgi:hypothetical protein